MALLLVVALGLVTAAPARAQIVRAFTPRYSTNTTGDIALIGNTLMSCSGGGSCTQARNGTGGNLDNNDWSMAHVDVDGIGGTQNSSRATLALPPGVTVLWAGLYWSGDSNSGARNTVRFSTPAAAYVTLTATQLDAVGSVYQGFVDVTARVLAGGNGTYTVGGVATTTGSNRFAGWGLVVVYRNPADPPRNLVVFDGYGQVAPGATQIINVAGFVTPPAGAVTTRLGVIAGEGDRGLTGDAFRLGATALGDAVNPATNFFNSTVSRLGAHVTAKTPNYPNQLGWDVDLVSANGVLPNGATGATITLNSTGDRYYPGVVTFATDLYQPILSGDSFTKTVTDLNGGTAWAGETMEYLITLSNIGNDAAAGIVVTDTIPAGAAYVPGSIVVTGGPGAGAKTDAAGDDGAEFDAAGNRVMVRLGAGATAFAGGRLAPASATSVRFRVTAGAPPGGVLSNQAVAAFTGEQTGTAFVTRSDGDLVTAGIQRTLLAVSAPALAGAVYDDRDHNAQRAPGEPGTGVATWVKLVSALAPGVALSVTGADPASGAFAFSSVAPGSYTLVLDDNAAPADVTPARPGGWIGTESAAGTMAVTVGTAGLTDLDFGLWHGSVVTGRVFRDDGAGGGGANDGAPQAGEAGVAGARMRALSGSCAGGVCDSAVTDGAGAFRLWLPHAASGAAVRIAETNLAGWVSTGGGAGSTGGGYSRSADEVSFVPASGGSYALLAFADVPPATWAAGGARTVVAGQAALYPHVFTPGSAGTLTLSVAASPAPAIPGWSLTLIHDLDCDGTHDAGESAIAAPIALAAGQSVCVLARHDSPAGAPDGAAEQVTITAGFDHTGAAPPLATSHALVDLTTVAAAGGLVLAKTADRAAARPGDVITYTITYFNPGPGPLHAIAIHDATPAFTVFDDATCGPLGTGLAGCSLSAAPAPGAAGPVTWTLNGTLAPGGSGAVTLRVRVM